VRKTARVSDKIIREWQAEASSRSGINYALNNKTGLGCIFAEAAGAKMIREGEPVTEFLTVGEGVSTTIDFDESGHD